ncbi:alpha/beta hydrolase [Arenivirga flava]|uniref:DUF1023 domain-containing protein n=1 Tax=Arenivirga flava TaxID=1930060 RepID=A0AA37UFI3_9MICO|nr:alpha/beta hydrolase [Arenivirga flava]GMA29364.1 hypothetical protein GCM10025874_26170 [Arenivirga flava]
MTAIAVAVADRRAPSRLVLMLLVVALVAGLAGLLPERFAGAAGVVGSVVAELGRQMAAVRPPTPARLPASAAPEELIRALDAGAAPVAAEAAAYWAGLAEEERAVLLERIPGAIGRLEGIGYGARDAGNRAALAGVLAGPSAGTATMTTAKAVTEVLDDVEARGLTAQLVSFDDSEALDARAAIAIGDLDTADSIAFLVPGMDYTVGRDLDTLTEAALNLYDAQTDRLLARGSTASHAVVSWLGYRTPAAAPSIEVLLEDRAVAGGALLAAALEGVRAVRGDAAELAVVAHSYGTRVATYALSDGATADALVLIASPGVAEEVRSVAQLDVPADRVWAATAQEDGPARLGLGLGALFGGNADPVAAAFGAQVFGQSFGADYDHGLLEVELTDGVRVGYLDQATESLREIAELALAA